MIQTKLPQDYYPTQDIVDKIILDDQGKFKIDKNAQAMIKLAKETGQDDILALLLKKNSSHPQKDHSFHYLPYHADSNFERTSLGEIEILTFPEINDLGLEVYYNGDRDMTEFKIECYKHINSVGHYIVMYTPDFIIIQRKDNKIYKIIIVETKSEAYANDVSFKAKKAFVENEFLNKNNDISKYKRFEYLYLKDILPENEL